MDALERINQLDRLYTGGRVRNIEEVASVECLLDILLLLHDECGQSTQRRERNFSEFVELSKYVCVLLHGCRAGLAPWGWRNAESISGVREMVCE
jgi:hypothetical protein